MKESLYYVIRDFRDGLWIGGFAILLLCSVLGYFGCTENVIFNLWPVGLIVTTVGTICEAIRMVNEDNFEPQDGESF
jgi:hypothetical protein